MPAGRAYDPIRGRFEREMGWIRPVLVARLAQCSWGGRMTLETLA